MLLLDVAKLTIIIIVNYMSTSRRQSEAIETRSVLLSTIHIICVLYTSKKISYFAHVRRGLSPVVCRQLSLPPTRGSLLLLIFLFFLPVVGRRSDSFFEIVDGVWPPGMFSTSCWTASWLMS